MEHTQARTSSMWHTLQRQRAHWHRVVIHTLGESTLIKRARQLEASTQDSALVVGCRASFLPNRTLSDLSRRCSPLELTNFGLNDSKDPFGTGPSTGRLIGHRRMTLCWRKLLRSLDMPMRIFGDCCTSSINGQSVCSSVCQEVSLPAELENKWVQRN